MRHGTRNFTPSHLVLGIWWRRLSSAVRPRIFARMHVPERLGMGIERLPQAKGE